MSEILEILVSGMSTKSEWSAKNPYFTNITENYVLNGASSKKETRHIVFNLGDSGLEYKAGDALGVVPRCPPELVEELFVMGQLDKALFKDPLILPKKNIKL